MPTADQKQMRVDYIIHVAKERDIALPRSFIINAQGGRAWKRIKELYQELNLDWQEDVPYDYSKAEDRVTQTTTPLTEYLQKAAGQLACARDSARELQPCPIEMVNRLDSMVKECIRLKDEEVVDYQARNAEKGDHNANRVEETSQ